ncbi:MAG: aminodeoxychorismate synthase component I [Chitinophagales bacterium]
MNAYGESQIPFLFIIDFELQCPIVLPLDEVNPKEIQFHFPFLLLAPSERKRELFSVKNSPSFSEGLRGRLQFTKHPMPFSQYQKAFHQVQQEINFGNSYLLNLTFPTPIETNLSLQEIFQYSQAKYKLYLQNQFVVFSPETFVKIQNGQIASFPMKGTIDAAIPDAIEQILADEKEKAEHHTIVDLIRNDLSMVSKNVRVESFRYIEEIQTHEGTLLQVSSKIVGDLAPDYPSKIGDLLFTLLPAGSISGAPKRKTIEIIQAAENYTRGYYTGIFGYFDGQNLDSAVMIRFIEKDKNGQLYFKSGGGITSLSQAETEYHELIKKVYVPISPTPRNHSVQEPPITESALSQPTL